MRKMELGSGRERAGSLRRGLIIIAVSLAMFGAAAVAMARHQHQPHSAYADLQHR
jgi:hypothetical protein